MTATINASTSAGVVVTSDTSGSLALQTNSGVTALTIDTSQRVGIGTASPTQKLEVAGQVLSTASSGASFKNITPTTGNNYVWLGNTGNNLYVGKESSAGGSLFVGSSAYAAVIGNDGAYPLQFATNNNVQATIDSSGNVGIGTSSIADTSSTGKVLEIYGGANAAHIHFTNSATGQTASDGFIVGTAVGTTDALLIQRESANMIFRTADTERMRIDSSGNLLVGTTSTQGAVVSVYCNDNSRNCITTKVFTNGNNAVGFQNSGGSQVGSITTNASTVAYNTSSDYRLKEDIHPITGALNKIALLKPCTYKWKIDGSAGEGFIAHELAEVCPHAVTGEKDAVDADGNPVYQGIDTSFLVATLTAALQEQQALITAQAETINALTARVVALEQR